ncbi:hypothetical protein NSA51_12160 [Flavonifractor plautii]|uniref:Uncharacterized protein n=2 Tax=Flavonifractor plautii TaxID=292800 RepID=A0AAX1KHY3_FLAPL|nr:DUF6674 family protein [Flavonifractor plautii]MCR1909826.1 hypothetical protein [Flavonifractor plautii]QQR05438.1 hypothetical protein I5Q84_15990 [Flavonifractor plautii]UQA26249.1 hypothetical protein M2853_16400 [Flavonifractor plautii]
MKQHNSPGREDLLAMCQQIAGLEQQLNSALEELSVMRQELAQARESPVKRALQKTVEGLEKVTKGLCTRLDSLKEKVVEGCKKTLVAFRERGASALAHTAEFLHIRPALEGISRELEKNIAFDDKALSIIEAASKEYHEAGRHLKNLVRAVQGREALDDPKGPGALARGLSLPFRQDRRLMCAMQSRTAGALKRLEHLEQAARPPIRQTMEECAKLAKAQESKERAAPAVSREAR